jgi:hypothetical protein
MLYELLGSQDSSISIAMDYRLVSLDSISSWGKTFLSSQQRPDQLRGPTKLLAKGYQGLFSLV